MREIANAKMKSAQSVAGKWGTRASGASNEYVEGAKNTTKDQSALAIAAIPRMKTALNQAIDSGRVAKGLNASGKVGWQTGITTKGGGRYSEGVSSATAQARYSANSGAYDTARNAAANLPKGDKGSAVNLNRVSTVVNALHKQKVG